MMVTSVDSKHNVQVWNYEAAHPPGVGADEPDGEAVDPEAAVAVLHVGHGGQVQAAELAALQLTSLGLRV